MSNIIEKNKNDIRSKFTIGKELGKAVNETRNKMNKLKAQLQELQINRAMQQMDLKENTSDFAEQEENIRNEIENQKQIYKKNYIALKQLKSMYHVDNFFINICWKQFLIN